MTLRVVGQVVEYQLTDAQASKPRSHPPSFNLTILGAKQFDATTADGSTTIADDEKGHRVGNQSLDAETMTAFARIERGKVRVELGNQGCRVRASRMLRCDDGCHVWRLLVNPDPKITQAAKACSSLS